MLLAVGTELGAETTRDWRLRPPTLVHADADPARIGASYPAAVGIVGDARDTLAGLVARVPAREPDGHAEQRVAALRETIERGLAAQGAELETGLLRSIRQALPADAISAWDMTILAYCASSYFPVLAPRRWLYPLGSGTLGYAWPAALGAKLALPGTPALAVHGDGGFQYGLAELASARQHGIAAALLLVDDGGYGILREYELDAYGETTAVDLAQPDFVRLAGLVRRARPRDVAGRARRRPRVGARAPPARPCSSCASACAGCRRRPDRVAMSGGQAPGHGAFGRQWRARPPSATIICPVTQRDSSEARKTTAGAMSSGWPRRGIACNPTTRS